MSKIDANLFVNAAVVLAVSEAFDAEPSGTTDKQFAALKALEDAMIVTLVPPTVAEPVANRKGVPLGDENTPTQQRLEQRLEAACRLIDSFNVYSIFSIKFVAEQQRFIKELRSQRT